MNNTNEEIGTWNKLAALYQEKFMNMELYHESYDFFLRELGAGACSILDVGCGPGIISRYMTDHHPGLAVTGIDYAASMVQLASAQMPDGRFMVMDCMELNRLEEKFDGIVCGFCIPYLSSANVSRLMTLFQELLKDDGVLYLSFVGGSPESSGPVQGSTGDSLYFNFHDPKKLYKALNVNNINIIKEFQLPYLKSDGSAETHIVWLARNDGL